MLRIIIVSLMMNWSLSSYGVTSWMEEIFQDRLDQPLNTIVIPGTHNSATDQMTSQSSVAESSSPLMNYVPKRKLVHWGKAQEHSIYQQLVDGIRYLDIRLERSGAEVYSFHGLRANSLNSTLHDLQKFAFAYPKEVVIVHFQSLEGFDSGMDLLVDRIKSYGLDQRAALYGNFDPTSSIGSFWQADKNLIFLSNKRKVSSTEDGRTLTRLFWPYAISNPWFNTSQTSQLKSDLLAEIALRPKSLFYVSQTILTPDPKMVSTGWMFGVRSIKGMAKRWINPILPELMRLIHEEAQLNERSLNIVIADYYKDSDMVTTALQLNRQNR